MHVQSIYEYNISKPQAALTLIKNINPKSQFIHRIQSLLHQRVLKKNTEKTNEREKIQDPDCSFSIKTELFDHLVKQTKV